MNEIPKRLLGKAGRFLDETPKQLSNNPCKDEYWRQLIQAIPFRIYTAVQIEEFADEASTATGSPGLMLLTNLRERGLEYDMFIDALKKINCTRAYNLFVPTTAPVITQQPQKNSFRTGQTLVLSCRAKCDPPPPKYQWYWNEEVPIPNGTEPDLVLPDVHVNHSGLYICKVSNGHDPKLHVWSETVQVDVVKFPIPETIAGDPQRMDYESSFSTLPTLSTSTMCTSDTDPSSMQSTGSSTSLMSRSGGRNSDADRISLLGQLSSISANSITTPSLPTQQELGNIEILQGLSGRPVRYNEPFTLECHARSKLGKEMTFTWKRKIRGNTEAEEVHKTVSVTSSVLNHQPLDQHGLLIIFCEIAHSDGSDKVIEKAKIGIETVWIVEPPQPINGITGQQATLYCRAEGMGKISYKWLKISKKNPVPVKNSNSESGVLVLTLEGDSWGEYICQAENAHDFVPSKPVSVRFRLENTKRLTIKTQPMSVVCEHGKPVTLTCVAQPTEGVYYQWYLNGSLQHRGNTNKLTINAVNDGHFGTYHCTASTSAHETVTSKKVKLYPRKVIQNDLKAKPKNKTVLDQGNAEYSFVTDDNTTYARDKVALLIGNQKYTNFSDLTSPHNDILELKKTLMKMDFKVFAYYDLGYEEIMSVIQKMIDMLEQGMNLVFYYSGHGFHHRESAMDYIMPVNVAATPLKCCDCISSKFITNKFQNTLCKVFAFFDCCRINSAALNLAEPDTSASVPYSNIIKILSCQEMTSAYEKTTEACSVFNRALRSGLEQKKVICKELGSHILEEMQKESQAKSGKQQQRSDTIIRMLPTDITLHEEILLETWNEFDPRLNRDMYNVPNVSPLVIEGMARADIKLSFPAVNRLRVTTTPVNNRRQCKGMDTSVTINNEGASPVPLPRTLDNNNYVFDISDLQKISQEVLTLTIEFIVTDCKDEHKNISRDVSVKLHSFALRLI